MKTEHVHEFLELARHKGFNRAARALYLSQSTLSSHINALEHELGTPLVDRASSQFTLTQAGKIFLTFAQDIVDLVDAAKSATSETEKSDGTVRLPTSFYVQPAVREVFARHDIALVPVDLPIGLTAIEAISQRIADLGWMPTTESDTTDPTSSLALGYASCPQRYRSFACSISHPLASKQHLTREDFRGATFLIGSVAWFDYEREGIQTALGDDLDLHFTLKPMENETELAYTELGNMIVSCQSEAIRTRYANRSDIHIIDEVDGAPLLELPSMLVYRNDATSPLSPDLMAAVIEAINKED